MRNRVTFIVDGFNLYHSLKQAERDLGDSTKWLNIKELCSSYLHLINKEASLESIYYFSALAEHLEAKNPDVTNRHRSFIKCLKNQGVSVELNRFKKKEVRCPHCHSTIIKHEEKETDVAICIKLMEKFIKDESDTAVIVSGDTDIAPAVRAAKTLFPMKQILFAFPYKRKNKELSKLCPSSFGIKKESYRKFQFANPYRLSDGSVIAKPPKW